MGILISFSYRILKDNFYTGFRILNFLYLTSFVSNFGFRASDLNIIKFSQIVMKKEIHPKYYESAQVVCSCGNKFVVGSTKEKLEVEICSACHPIYTGNEKVIDTAGRVERFKARQAKSAAQKTIKK